MAPHRQIDLEGPENVRVFRPTVPRGQFGDGQNRTTSDDSFEHGGEHVGQGGTATRMAWGKSTGRTV
jgi:hypothetical protein